MSADARFPSMLVVAFGEVEADPAVSGHWNLMQSLATRLGRPVGYGDAATGAIFADEQGVMAQLHIAPGQDRAEIEDAIRRAYPNVDALEIRFSA